MAMTADERRTAWGKVVAQAWDDEDYRKRLVESPAEVMSEAGFEVPDGVRLSVVEGKPGEVTLVLPAPPTDRALDDVEVEEVSGGFTRLCGGPCYFS